MPVFPVVTSYFLKIVFNCMSFPNSISFRTRVFNKGPRRRLYKTVSYFITLYSVNLKCKKIK